MSAPHPLPVKRSVALVIREGRRVLAVLRPPDDEDLPNVWGLPAGTLQRGESWAEVVRRAAREKLDVEVEPTAVLNEGRAERTGYVLHMRLYEAPVVAGEPRVLPSAHGRTSYADWQWAEPGALEPAAEWGSLCSRLFLATEG